LHNSKPCIFHVGPLIPRSVEDRVRDDNELGFLPNIFALIAESEPALKAFVELNGLFGQSSFSEKEQQIILLAASAENECAYCMAGHTVFARSAHMEEDVIEAMRSNSVVCDQRLNVLNLLVRELIKTGGQVPSKIVEKFLEAGFSRGQFMELVLGICVKTFSNYLSNALEVPLDEEFQRCIWHRPAEAA